VQRDHVAHGNSQPVDDRLASADPVKANYVRMLRLEGLGHPSISTLNDA
jgi:hypothetical protein